MIPDDRVLPGDAENVIGALILENRVGLRSGQRMDEVARLAAVVPVYGYEYVAVRKLASEEYA